MFSMLTLVSAILSLSAPALLPAQAAPLALDGDGDGYDAGAGDCDDADPAINPGAAESCNAVDDNCDGTADESGCACAHATDGLHDFLFCATPRSWADAAADCAGWGYRLADVEDSAENAWIWAQAELVRSGNAWWIGLNDRAVEGDFTWESGSTAAWRSWRAGEPNDFNGNEDCGKYHINGGGLWNDANCADSILYICEAGCVYEDSYLDSDGDGWGDPATLQRGCGIAAGYVGAGGDCDDADPAVHPGTLEQCGGTDEDCDGLTDDADPALDPASASAWYADSDADGWGAGAALYACAQPPGYAADPADCDDADPAAFPGALEIRADGIDQDCDGADTCRWYADADGDGWGDPADPSPGCDQPAGYVGNDGDCDDADPAISPGAAEVWYDGVDADCSGGSDDDQDGDGSDSDLYGGDDCDDLDPLATPGRAEQCDGADNDCDGLIDGATSGCPCASAAYGPHAYLICAEAATWQEAQDACLAVGYDLAQIESADEDAWLWSALETASPVGAWWIGLTDQEAAGAAEGAFLWPDGSDPAAWNYSNWRSGEPNDFGGNEDCARYPDDGGGVWADGDCASEQFYACEAGCPIVLSWPDGDGDGAGDASLPSAACGAGAGMVTVGGDCDDADPAVGPGGLEVCDGLDNDCDGLADDADPSVDPAAQTRWYPDGDGDGWGVESGDLLACAGPEGFVGQSGDCDDRSADSHPGATELNDNLDNDCDGYTELEDADGDGLNHLLEQSVGSDPYDPDSDGDGLSDGDEVVVDGGTARDTDGDGTPDWADTDDDGDGVPTAGECGDTDLATPPPDTDGDGAPDPLDDDSDGDTLWDGAEAGRDSDGDGADDRIDTDDDGDGIPTAAEATVDTDGDGGSDFDVDGDSLPNHLDTDSDGDGCPDAEEGDGDGNGDGLPDFADATCGAIKDDPCGCAADPGTTAGALLLLTGLAAARRSRTR